MDPAQCQSSLPLSLPPAASLSASLEQLAVPQIPYLNHWVASKSSVKCQSWLANKSLFVIPFEETILYFFLNMFPNNLSNAIVSLGGQVFDSILKVKGEGAYVQVSQMNSLVELLNRASFKLETIEDEVDRNETLIQILLLSTSVWTLARSSWALISLFNFVLKVYPSSSIGTGSSFLGG